MVSISTATQAKKVQTIEDALRNFHFAKIIENLWIMFLIHTAEKSYLMLLKVHGPREGTRRSDNELIPNFINF